MTWLPTDRQRRCGSKSALAGPIPGFQLTTTLFQVLAELFALVQQANGCRENLRLTGILSTRVDAMHKLLDFRCDLDGHAVSIPRSTGKSNVRRRAVGSRLFWRGLVGWGSFPLRRPAPAAEEVAEETAIFVVFSRWRHVEVRHVQLGVKH